MLYIKDKIMKVGGVYIGGEVISVKIDGSAIIDDIEDSKGKSKKNQPVGYDPVSVSVSVKFLATKSHTALEQVRKAQRLFQKSGQTKPKMMRITNAHTAARGISKVYFEKFTTTDQTDSEIITGEFQFITQRKTRVIVNKSSSENSQSDSSDSSDSKTKKDTTKSAAKDTRNASSAKKKARKLAK